MESFLKRRLWWWSRGIEAEAVGRAVVGGGGGVVYYKVEKAVTENKVTVPILKFLVITKTTDRTKISIEPVE